METADKASSKEKAAAPLSPRRLAGRSGRRAGLRAGMAAAVCTAALVLSACSASQAESTAGETNNAGETESADTEETTQTSAPAPSPSASAGESDVAGDSDVKEPLAPEIAVDGVSPSGWRVLSEQGTGTGTHDVKGGLEAGQVLSLSVSCTPGDSVSIRRGMTSYKVACTSPGSSVFFEAPADEAVSDIEVTVKTAGGSPYWLAGWVHDVQ